MIIRITFADGGLPLIARRGAVFGSLASFLFPPPPPRPLFSFSLSFALYASRFVATLAVTPLEPHGAHTRDDYPVQFLWYRTAMTEKRASMPFAAVRTVKLICGRPDRGMCVCARRLSRALVAMAYRPFGAASWVVCSPRFLFFLLFSFRNALLLSGGFFGSARRS